MWWWRRNSSSTRGLALYGCTRLSLVPCCMYSAKFLPSAPCSLSGGLGGLFSCSSVDSIQTALCYDIVLWESDRARPPGSTISQTWKVAKWEYTLHLIIPACSNSVVWYFHRLLMLPRLPIIVDPDDLALARSHQCLSHFAGHANHDPWHSRSQTFTYILVLLFFF